MAELKIIPQADAEAKAAEAFGIVAIRGNGGRPPITGYYAGIFHGSAYKCKGGANGQILCYAEVVTQLKQKRRGGSAYGVRRRHNCLSPVGITGDAIPCTGQEGVVPVFARKTG